MNPSVDSANAGYGLPKMSDIYSNIQAPSLSDIGGSLGAKAGDINQGTTGAFQSYANYAGSLTKPQDYYQGLLDQNGIPQLQKTSENLQNNVNDLSDQIYRVTPNVTATTGNSLVTDAQRQGMITQQELPLRRLMEPTSLALGQVNTSLATQEANIANQVGAMNTGNQQMLGVGAMGVTVAQDNAARQMSGYTQDADNMLQGLLKKMDIQGTLDAAEWTTLSQLAENKQKYDQTLGQIKAQAQADVNVNNSKLITLNPAQRVYNPVTGKTH